MIVKLLTAGGICLALAVCTGDVPQPDALQRKLGFACAQTDVVAGGEKTTLPGLRITDAKGAFASAGIADGALLPTFERCDELYAELHRTRGRNVSLTLVAGGNGPPVRHREHRVISLPVPENTY